MEGVRSQGWRNGKPTREIGSASTKGPLVPPAVGRVEVDVARALWLWGMLIPAVVFGIPSLTPTLVVVTLLLTFATLCVGHSVGLHRGIIHESYSTTPLVRGVMVYLFVLTGLGGPLSWIRLHAARDYWQSTEDCPRYFAYRHGLIRDFAWNLHMRFVPADDRAAAKLPGGVEGDRWLRFLERTWPLHVLGSAAAIFAIWGFEAVAVCVCGRVAASILGHWFVGYAAHAWGERRFEVPGASETGTNVWCLGVLSFGEGFHNNHHAFPRSARMGLQPIELDVGWQVLRALRALGLVWNLREAKLD